MVTTKQIGIAVLVALIATVANPVGPFAALAGRFTAGICIVLGMAYLYNRRQRSTTQT